MTYEEYQIDLKNRQQTHLKDVQRYLNQNWRPCLHDHCPFCIGTGIKVNGSICLHMIACSCPRCSPSYSTGNPILVHHSTDLTVTTSSIDFKIDENFNGTISNAQNS